MMTKKQNALRNALALHRFGKQMIAEKGKHYGYQRYCFHSPGKIHFFHRPEEAIALANQIARSLKENA